MNRALSFQLSVFFMLLVVSFCIVEGRETTRTLSTLEGTPVIDKLPCKKYQDCYDVCAKHPGCVVYNCTPLGWCWCIMPKSGDLIRC
ncbi:hypothetical protein LINGRAHAP2_LOCUS35707 [Linum grandiflorum]